MKRGSKKFDYEELIQLYHNEIPAKIDIETGEIVKIYSPEEPMYITFDADITFKKHYDNSWAFILREFSPLEVSATTYLIQLSKMNTGSLKPLSDKSTVRELSELLNVSINKVTTVLKKLFIYGVYGKFEVFNPDKPFTKYWIINPYLVFAGRKVDLEIVRLFHGTYIHKAFNDPNFVFQKTKRNLHIIESSQKCDRNI